MDSVGVIHIFQPSSETERGKGLKQKQSCSCSAGAREQGGERAMCCMPGSAGCEPLAH